MAFVRDGLTAVCQDYIEKKVNNSFVQFRPMLYFMGLRTAEGNRKLGRPGTAAVFGCGNMSQAKVQTLAKSYNIQHRYAKTEPNDGARVEYRGATPTASAFSEDNYGTTEFRWTQYTEPMKVGNHILEMAKEDLLLTQSIYEDAMNETWERLNKRINADVWAGTLTAAQQNKTMWSDGVLGVTHTLTASNTYGRVDRSVETTLQPLVVDATALATTVVTLDVNRQINVGGVFGSTTITGLAGKSDNGRGADVFITTPTLWNALASEAEGRFSITQNGIPNTAIAGFNYPVIHKDNVYFTYDPDCPSGQMYALNLDTWLMEIQGERNFKVNPWVNSATTVEGGAEYRWSNITATIRMSCTKPWLNARIHGLTTS